jgi:hypothetical protein
LKRLRVPDADLGRAIIGVSDPLRGSRGGAGPERRGEGTFRAITQPRRVRNSFHLVDVFARERYAGNQLAVVEDADTLDDEEMRAFAAEIGFSETTFVGGRSTDGGP